MGSGRANGWQRQVLGYWVVVVVALQYSSSERLQCGAVRPLVAATLVRDSQLPRAHLNAGAPELQGIAATPSLETESSEFLSYNNTRRSLGGCGKGNPVDDCWRCNGNWEQNRQALAECAIGFGKNAIGGKNGQIYVVTDESDDDVVNPKMGTLRYAVVRSEPLWITFSRNMNIKLKEELIMNSFKTIDGRGHNVHISGGACITLQFVNNIIIHGVHIHDCKSTGPADVRSSPSHYGRRGKTDGDGVNIFGSHDIWLDHCYFAQCTDGLVDVIKGSTDITISNNYFENHDKVMLLGAHAEDTMDADMQVTIAFNHFGANLIERMPRCRLGKFHVVNNNYQGWGMYAIGGSENPTINSEGNRFFAPNEAKEVTKRLDEKGTSWNWRSSGDVFLNGAFFTASGASGANSQFYAKATSFSARPASMVQDITVDSGPLACSFGAMC